MRRRREEGEKRRREARARISCIAHPAFRISLFTLVSLSPCLLACPSRADRLVLAPRALITIPNSAKAELAVRPERGKDNLEWVSAGLPGSLNGFELELQRLDLGGDRKTTGSLQYSFTGNAFTDIAPAFSVGIRDLADNGFEGRALFAAATKTIPLSLAQSRLVRQLSVDAGYGTSHLGGAYIGIQGKLPFGPVLSAEYVARRFNASLAIPLSRHCDLKAYALNGYAFYGATFYLVK